MDVQVLNNLFLTPQRSLNFHCIHSPPRVFPHLPHLSLTSPTLLHLPPRTSSSSHSSTQVLFIPLHIPQNIPYTPTTDTRSVTDRKLLTSTFRPSLVTLIIIRRLSEIDQLPELAFCVHVSNLQFIVY